MMSKARSSNVDGRSTRFTEANRVMEAAILQYIRAYRDEKGYSPSIPEIGEAVGRKSYNSVRLHLQRMEKRGLIRRDKGVSRAHVPID